MGDISVLLDLLSVTREPNAQKIISAQADFRRAIFWSVSCQHVACQHAHSIVDIIIFKNEFSWMQKVGNHVPGLQINTNTWMFYKLYREGNGNIQP